MLLRPGRHGWSRALSKHQLSKKAVLRGWSCALQRARN